MQTAYSINIPAYSYPGQIADLVRSKIRTALAATVAIPYGVYVVLDTANSSGLDLAGKLPGASTDITVVANGLGVAVADQARAQDPSVALPTYPLNAAVPCLYNGDVVVVVEEAVNAGDPVFVRYAAGTFAQLGAFRKSADTATAAQLPNAVYKSSAAIGGFAVVSINNT